MCNCISELESQVFDKFIVDHPNPAVKPISSFFENSTLTTPREMFAPVEIEFLHGKRKQKRLTNVFFSYCPFCGEFISKKGETK